MSLSAPNPWSIQKDTKPSRGSEQETRDEREKPLDEDQQLMLAVGQGDEAALRVLIERWQSPLVNFLYRATQSREDSEDIAQATFVRLYRAAPRYQPVARFSTFLFQIARRLLINHYRSQSRKPMQFVDPADLTGTNANDQGQRKLEWEDALEMAIAKLPEKQRTALLLLKQQELSYEEIAELMKASVSAVKTWIFRGRQSLKSTLADLR